MELDIDYKVGDEVADINDGEKAVIISDISTNRAFVLTHDGEAGIWEKKYFKPTGKRYSALANAVKEIVTE